MAINPFNIIQGMLLLENGLIISPRATVEKLRTDGFVFVRDLHLNAGWSLLSTTDYSFGEDLAYFSFRIFGGVASGVSFGLCSQRGKAPQEQQRIYAVFLKKWLGDPTSTDHDGQLVSYTFAWGAIVSAYDPRNGTTSMDLTWKAKS